MQLSTSAAMIHARPHDGFHWFAVPPAKSRTLICILHYNRMYNMYRYIYIDTYLGIIYGHTDNGKFDGNYYLGFRLCVDVLVAGNHCSPLVFTPAISV